MSFSSRAYNQATTHAIATIRQTGQDRIQTIVVNAGIIVVQAKVNHAIAVVASKMFAVNSGFSSIHVATFSIIGVIEVNNLSRTGTRASPMTFFVFSRVAFNFEIFSCMVN